jgi:membrane protein implicated in regulation of membrane protease activity
VSFILLLLALLVMLVAPLAVLAVYLIRREYLKERKQREEGFLDG